MARYLFCSSWQSLALVCRQRFIVRAHEIFQHFEAINDDLVFLHVPQTDISLEVNIASKTTASRYQHSSSLCNQTLAKLDISNGSTISAEELDESSSSSFRTCPLAGPAELSNESVNQSEVFSCKLDVSLHQIFSSRKTECEGGDLVIYLAYGDCCVISCRSTCVDDTGVRGDNPAQANACQTECFGH